MSFDDLMRCNIFCTVPAGEGFQLGPPKPPLPDLAHGDDVIIEMAPQRGIIVEAIVMLAGFALVAIVGPDVSDGGTLSPIPNTTNSAYKLAMPAVVASGDRIRITLRNISGVPQRPVNAVIMGLR